ncbi:LOW QUALITY PROTEIN: reverse transcriptase [Phytophthora megakarya]|uniref:Reverse transcriptase n=1 Tax=Phytophthora megakarya TaxID=4795 RepID=A0A225W3W4_9STRA|nr:LOW QUALITY PROTEIN: reverse transcriptase [Phytophthora megakarya]
MITSRDCQVSSQRGPALYGVAEAGSGSDRGSLFWGSGTGSSPCTCGGAPRARNLARNTAKAKIDSDEESETGHKSGDPLDQKDVVSMSQKRDGYPAAVPEDQPDQRDTSDLGLTWDSDQDYDECVYYHEGTDLYAEDVDGQLAIPEEIDRLRRIWKFRHLLIGKGNALPPAAPGVVCDIDVGGARPTALKCRKLRIQFREKLAELIKGLLSAKMINDSRSPWASPIVVIIKKNGWIYSCVLIIGCLTQLVVYPMPLINDLLMDLESTLWYCSLDMASGF